MISSFSRIIWTSSQVKSMKTLAKSRRAIVTSLPTPSFPHVRSSPSTRPVRPPPEGSIVLLWPLPALLSATSRHLPPKRVKETANPSLSHTREASPPGTPRRFGTNKLRNSLQVGTLLTSTGGRWVLGDVGKSQRSSKNQQELSGPE